MKSPRKIKTALVLIGLGSTVKASIKLARMIAREVVLLGVVMINKDESLSAGAEQARVVRKRLIELSKGPAIRFKSTVIVSQSPWQDIQKVVSLEKPDILMLEWTDGMSSCGIPIPEILSSTLCDIAIVRGGRKTSARRTLVAARGGPYAELSLKLGMHLSPRHMDMLHLSLTGIADDGPFKGINRILKHIPEVKLNSITTDDGVRTTLEESKKYSLVILGATAGTGSSGSCIGPMAEKLLQESPATVMVVKPRLPLTGSMIDERAGIQAISILVDKWFAENTFHADEFAKVKNLLKMKREQGATISLAMPSLNEEQTVGKVIATIKKALMDKVPLLDEIVLIDSNSTDRTREVAEKLGVPVHIHQHLLPELGAREGKGEALWKSLLITKGDIIAWIDTDIVNIHPRFVTGILGPLLLNRNIQLVKGFYRRPIKMGKKMEASGGGRVTELTARPLINLFYPELSGLIQPLAGEYAGRRESLEKAVFYSGYGVEMGLLIDIFENYGLGSIAQVDLLERVHHNQELEALSKMSFAIIQTVLRKLETRYERSIIEDVNKTMKLIRYENGGYSLVVDEVAEFERPPMNTVPAYLHRLKSQ
jgi:glycosyltransferase involved in cell wall biosynthesis